MQAAKNITVIPATRMMHTGLPRNAAVRKRVAGYARVSTDSEEQQTSYEAQVDYYTNYIQSKPDWEFVTVYTDEGISALNTKHRDGFNEMIQDALDGKIDLIVTKSVSRFARNTVDSLTTVRKLKEKGVEVYFEKEQIFTLDSKGELLITIMSSLAQEESRSISENVTWGQRKRFADGKVSIPYGQFLGYRKGADGLPEIVPEEAETVRTIYRLFIQGKTTNAIAASLTRNGVPTPGGKEKWQATTIESILTNEKYKGSALLQKKFTTNFLTKKMKPNDCLLYTSDVYFEEQNIHTMSADGELMLSILASYAQEESRSASENQKWRIRKNFHEGMPWNGTMLGYRYENGKYIIVPEEAEIVRKIYSYYTTGLGITAIMKTLNEKHISTRNGLSLIHICRLQT